MTIVVETLECYHGSDFARVLTWTDGAGVAINITAFTASMSVLKEYLATSVINLTTGNGRIALGDSNGEITLTITAADTADLTPGAYIYYIEMMSSTDVVTRIAQGIFNVNSRSSAT